MAITQWHGVMPYFGKPNDPMFRTSPFKRESS